MSEASGNMNYEKFVADLHGCDVEPPEICSNFDFDSLKVGEEKHPRFFSTEYEKITNTVYGEFSNMTVKEEKEPKTKNEKEELNFKLESETNDEKLISDFIDAIKDSIQQKKRNEELSESEKLANLEAIRAYLGAR